MDSRVGLEITHNGPISYLQETHSSFPSLDEEDVVAHHLVETTNITNCNTSCKYSRGTLHQFRFFSKSGPAIAPISELCTIDIHGF